MDSEHLDHQRDELPGSDGEKRMQEHLGTVERATAFYENAMVGSLNDRMMAFLRDRATAFVGCNWTGSDVTVRVRDGSPIEVLDRDRIAWVEEPDWSFQVLAEAADHATVMTVDWERTTVGLHVNGPISVHDHDGSGVECRLDVEEAYIHCAKHLPRLERRSSADATEFDADVRPGTWHSLPDHLESFVEDRIFFLLGTADEHGETDISPRFGPQGFVRIRNECLVYPEFRGNGVHASLGNMLGSSRACMTFVDWWQSGIAVEIRGDVQIQDERPIGVTEVADPDRTKVWVQLVPDTVSARAIDTPRYALDEYDPHWGTDDAGLKKSGFFCGE